MRSINIKIASNFLLICGIILYSKLIAQDYPDKKLITLTEQGSYLRDVIDKITSQTNVFFIYDDFLVENKKISCDFKAEPITKIMGEIVKQTNLSFKSINNNTFVLYKNNEEIYENIISSNKISNGVRRNSIISPPERKVSQLPDYPTLAKQKNIEGNVKINLLINKSGKVEKVRLLKSSGHEILDKAAIDYSKEIFFEPAKKGDTSISTWYPMDFNYKLFNSGFLPEDYINEIKTYYSQIKNSTQDKHKVLQKKILDTHIRYNTSFSNEEVNINYYLEKILSANLKKEWVSFWKNKALNFLIFHDFIKHCSNEELNNRAKSYLVKFLSKEIENDSDLPQTTQELFQKKVYTFLEKNYPEVINKVFGEEVKLN